MIIIVSLQYCDRAKQTTAIFKWTNEAVLDRSGEETRLAIGSPYSITCEIISNVSDAPGDTRIRTLQKYVSK